MRVYELARELGLPSRDLLGTLHALGFAGVTTASSNVPVDALPLVRPHLEPAEPEPEPGLAEAATESAKAHEDPRSVVARLRERAAERAQRPGAVDPGGARSRIRSVVRRLVMGALWIVVGLGAGFVLAITLPYLQGNRSLTVLSGSMEPEIHTGDVVVVEQIAPLDARVGDIVSFRDPDDPSRLITHRVRAIQVDENEVEFVTKGDANTAIEQWRITPDGQIGRVVFRVPRIGYVLFYLRGSVGRMLLIVLPALLLGAYELWRIWRPTHTGHDLELADGAAPDPSTEAAG